MGEKKISSYQDLRIWQNSMDLAEKIYNLTRKYPKSEQFGLIAQMRRAAISVPANIAEGWSRTSKEFCQYLRIALGSLRELETYLLLSVRVKILSYDDISSLLEEIQALSKQILTL